MRLLISCAMLSTVLSVTHMQAQSPQAPQAGSFTVNSAQDNATADASLTLREAILVANGGTSPSGLNRPVTLNERNQLAGCQFILIPPALTTALIVSGCGDGEDDTITVNGISLITLTKALPMLTDDATTLNGAAVRLNAANVISGSTMTISASHTMLNNFVIVNTPSDAADVEILGGTVNVLRNLVLGFSSGATACNSNEASRFGVHGIHIHKNVTGTESAGAGSAYLYANTMGCHGKAGVYVAGAGFVRIGERANGTLAANYIGLSNAKQALPNGVGIRLDAASGNATSNRIVGNYISGNSGNGIELIGEPGFSSNARRVEKTTIRGNDIGVDRANGGSGIYLSGTNQNNVIGGKTDEDRNTISGNGQHGIFAENPMPMAGPDVAMAYIGGNYIGTNLTGTLRLPNQGHGIYLKNASAFIGLLGTSADALAGNLIAGNAQDGVRIESGFAFVLGNSIGTDKNANDLGNGGDGLSMVGGAAYVGYYPLQSTVATGNRIQFNRQNGLRVNGGEAVIGGNTIADNAQNGVHLSNGANEVKVGLDEPPGYGNEVRGNGGNGVWIEGVLSASVRSNVVISNGGYGILMEGAGAQATVISATVVASNGRDGVAEKGGATKNSWAKLEAYGNGGLGIDKAVTSDDGNTPNKPSVLITLANKPEVTHTHFSGISTPSALVEVYALAPDPTTYGEGKTFLGRAKADAGGNWRMTVQDAAPLSCYTAFETVTTATSTASSEYSKSSCIKEVFLPVLRR